MNFKEYRSELLNKLKERLLTTQSHVIETNYYIDPFSIRLECVTGILPFQPDVELDRYGIQLVFGTVNLMLDGGNQIHMFITNKLATIFVDIHCLCIEVLENIVNTLHKTQQLEVIKGGLHESIRL